MIVRCAAHNCRASERQAISDVPCPSLLAWIIPPEAQQECGDLLAVTRVVYVRGLASAHEVTHGFVPLVWNPHGDQLSSPEQLGQVERVATVGLDAVTRFAGNEEGAATLQLWPSSLIKRKRP